MKRKNISMDLLLLSDGNPRLDPSLGEDESISNMVKDQNDKLYELALDIVEYGLNPLDTIGVFPSETYIGYYEVGEGNRRMCALKLLMNPDRLQYLNHSLYTKFQTLAKAYVVPDSLEVAVFDNEASIHHWMEIRHMGEQSGKGLSKWNSIQKSRFKRMQTGSDALLDFWDWMTENNILTKDEISGITKTNWQRILREKYFSFLKLQYDGKYSVLPQDIEIFTERIKVVQQKLDGQTVAVVYDQKRIEEFYNTVSNKLYGLPYQQIVERESNQISINNPVENLDNDSEHFTSTSTDNSSDSENMIGSDETFYNTTSTSNNPTSMTGRDVFNGCDTIIPRNYAIRSSNMRLNKIINELKRLNADDYPNACGTLLRTLFELSAKVFLENQDGSDHTATKFEQAIKSAANALRGQNRISNSQHSAIVSDIDNLRKIFNGYMHDTDGYPSSESLKNFFKSHKVFIEECLK